MLANFRKNRVKIKATNEFRDYLLAIVFFVGDIYGRKNAPTDLINEFADRVKDGLSIRQRAFLRELVLNTNVDMASGQQVIEFVFEYFFILYEDFSSEIQHSLKDDFINKIKKAFYTNGIYREVLAD